MAQTGVGQTGKKFFTRSIKWGILFFLFASVVDQLTKIWAKKNLVDSGEHPLLGKLLTLKLISNPGAAFSMGEGHTWIFTVVSIAVLAITIWFFPRIRHTRTAIAVGLLAGGALGNLIDRLIQPPSIGRGHVIDFIQYGNFFIGNIADICIVLGAFLILLFEFVWKDNEPNVKFEEHAADD